MVVREAGSVNALGWSVVPQVGQQDQIGRVQKTVVIDVGALGRLLRRKGWFYRVAGMQAATIDAAGTSPLQPDCVIMGPKDPDAVAQRIKSATGLEAAVVDVNDIGGSWVLGATPGVDRPRVQRILRDNPLGQKAEQTPIGLIRVSPR